MADVFVGAPRRSKPPRAAQMHPRTARTALSSSSRPEAAHLFGRHRPGRRRAAPGARGAGGRAGRPPCRDGAQDTRPRPLQLTQARGLRRRQLLAGVPTLRRPRGRARGRLQRALARAPLRGPCRVGGSPRRGASVRASLRPLGAAPRTAGVTEGRGGWPRHGPRPPAAPNFLEPPRPEVRSAPALWAKRRGGELLLFGIIFSVRVPPGWGLGVRTGAKKPVPAREKTRGSAVTVTQPPGLREDPMWVGGGGASALRHIFRDGQIITFTVARART